MSSLIVAIYITLLPDPQAQATQRAVCVMAMRYGSHGPDLATWCAKVGVRGV